MGEVPRLSDDERKLLAGVSERKAKDPASALKLDEKTLLESFLFASGVEDAGARGKYRTRFDQLLAEARPAVQGARNNRERGEKLMTFLHDGMMKKGYEANQTSFTGVFDTGQFNCVSATAMYYLVGTRLGLELRAISIPGSGFLPGHASLDMIEGGQRIQVEPTNRDGFDWGMKVKRPGVIVLGLIPDRKNSHEVDAAGIAAMIYSNRGVALANAKPPRQLEAARCYLAALALDPADGTACNNLTGIFVNWGPKLSQESQHEDAVRVLGFGRSLAPKLDSLRNNQRIAWAAFIDAELAAGKDTEALAVVRRAARAVPDDRDFQSGHHWFSRHGEKRIPDKGWEAGLAVVERGLKVLPKEEMPKLLAWRSSVFRRWSQSLLEKNDAGGSLKVLARAYALDPADREIIAGIAYHTQEALPLLERGPGLPAMTEHYAALVKAFPKVKNVAEVGRSHVERAVKELADKQQFREAIAAVEKYRALLPEPKQREEVLAGAYEHWARHLADRKEWKAALDKCAEGFKATNPQQEALAARAVITVNKWAAPAIDAKQWDEAIRIYKIGLEYRPGDRDLQHNLDVCQKRKEGK
jgi:tetratricopeptide (TPR) repeat protein